MARDKFNFREVIEALRRIRTPLVRDLANDCRNYFLASFDHQGWDGKPWKVPQRKQPGTNAYKYPKKGAAARHSRNVLIGKGSGRLRRAVANSLEKCNWDNIIFVVRLPYARAHNDGLGVMPMRRYMGQTLRLRDIHFVTIHRHISGVWRA